MNSFVSFHVPLLRKRSSTTFYITDEGTWLSNAPCCGGGCTRVRSFFAEFVSFGRIDKMSMARRDDRLIKGRGMKNCRMGIAV